MSTFSGVNKIKIAFFSGTGGTARVANTFEKSLEAKGKIVIKHELNSRNKIINDSEDMLIIIYAVHACNAPESVYEYIDAIPKVDNKLAVVISVSGGGEITPNTACRLHCIKRLEKKGFNVIYEKMLIMPSNWIIPTIDGLAVRLLEVLPTKIDKIIDDLSSDITFRTKPSLLNRFLSYIGEFEKVGARSFGKRIKANENCNGCGWCEKACPRSNITLVNGTPVFNNNCLLCLKCIYGCPQRALEPGIGKFIVIKQGYNLNAIEKNNQIDRLDSVEKLAKGYLWKGIKEYLLNDN
ncbi:EFR1 family ferrodoxin [Desnuesiella massiliensis]|uniref:EFR1 family ferrodoxin n=1 Tax=Desnuesiella massiliensis TaxID=1650662 RepID=UPI0006E3FBED|nr:EFR1 family ferrodoxin [Desnuesiella massiliensis]